jgi:hypothetical protein
MRRPETGPVTGRLIAVLMVVTVLSCATGRQAERSAAFVDEVRSKGGTRIFRGNTLSVQQGIPVLTLSGTSYDMGVAYGVLLKNRLEEMMKELEGLKQAAISYRNFIERWLAPAAIDSYIDRMRKRIPSEYLEELQGVADGSGLEVDDLVFAAGGAGMFEQPMESGVPHCTSILYRLPDRILHGRNFDFLPAIMGNYPLIVHYKPSSGYGYWSFGVIGFLPAFHGINEKGLSATLNYGVMSYDEQSQGLLSTYKMRKLLNECGTLQEAGDLLIRTPADEPGWMFTIGSAEEGEGAVFDILGRDRGVSPFNEPDYKMVLNRQFSYTRYPDGELARKGLYFSDGEGEYNVARYHSGTDYLKTHRLSSGEDMIGFLRLTDFYGYEIVNNYNASIANSDTLYTLVFDWKSRKVLVSWGLAYAPLHKMLSLDLATDAVALHVGPDPRIEAGPYRRFIEGQPGLQLHMASNDRQWIAAHTDFGTADPYDLQYNIDSWKKDPEIVSKDLLQGTADRLISLYPDYNLPYALKAEIVAADSPREAIALYRAALAARILFAPDRVTYLAKIAELHHGLQEEALATSAAKDALALIEEARKKYRLDRQFVEMESRLEHLVK